VAQRRESKPFCVSAALLSRSSANGKRGYGSLYLHGAENALVRRPPTPREKLEQDGGWSPAQLIRIDADFLRRDGAGDLARPRTHSAQARGQDKAKCELPHTTVAQLRVTLMAGK